MASSLTLPVNIDVGYHNDNPKLRIHVAFNLMCNLPVVLEKLIPFCRVTELSSSGKVTPHECFLSVGGVLRIDDDGIQGGDRVTTEGRL